MNFTSLYEQMFYQCLRIRMLEERLIELYPSDKIQSPVHLSIGQEPVAVGICQALKHTDLLFGSYRSHAFYLAKGGDIREMVAELYGKRTGCAGGKAGSMHLTAPDVGFMGCSAVVASTIPHAVGAALAAKQLKKQQVIVSVFGDGATEEGVYHESLNFAMLHKLPIIFVCENNGLAVHSRLVHRQSYEIVEHAKQYGLQADRITNGMDFMEIFNVFDKKVADVQAGKGPQYLEIHTYRYKEHVGPGDDFNAGYRNRTELEHWLELDPLLNHPDLVDQFKDEITEEIDDAVFFAEKSPWPGKEDLLTQVY